MISERLWKNSEGFDTAGKEVVYLLATKASDIEQADDRSFPINSVFALKISSDSKIVVVTGHGEFPEFSL